MKKKLLSIIVSLTSFTIPIVSFAHERDLTLQEVVHFPEAIVVGRVSEIRGFDGGGDSP
jgi:hypothetical protein